MIAEWTSVGYDLTQQGSNPTEVDICAPMRLIQFNINDPQLGDGMERGTLETTPREVIVGRVKWFNAQKGFGFINPDGGGEDILLHKNVLSQFGQSSIADGLPVRVVVEATKRGRQAVQLLEILKSSELDLAELDEFAGLSPDVIARLPFLPARLKWFDRGKGFGFATLFGDSRDTFLHVEVVRHGGMDQPAPGEALALKVIQGKRGLIAVELMSWDQFALHRSTS